VAGLQPLLAFAVPRCLRGYTWLVHGCAAVGPVSVPARGPCLVIANHRCHADAAFLMAASGRWIHFLQAREEYEVPFLRFFFRLVGCIPIQRGARDRSGLRLALERLEHGTAVGVFPEGELTPPGEELHRPGKNGAAWLALRSRAPVIPAYITGAPRPRGTALDWLWPTAAVRVRFGPPIELDEFYDQPLAHARLCAVTELFMQRIADLRRPAAGAASTSWPGRSQSATESLPSTR
jgi:1-acyl-sn-glycerol-3-phosphate acyltransferase